MTATMGTGSDAGKLVNGSHLGLSKEHQPVIGMGDRYKTSLARGSKGGDELHPQAPSTRLSRLGEKRPLRTQGGR